MASISDIVSVIEEEHGWERLYRQIKATSAQFNLSCKVARSQENRLKNRYRDVSPFDHSRVKLKKGSSDYINSSLVEMEKAGRRYILTQGPLPGTSGHFWQMVWEQNSKAVIMLNKVIEKGARKCHQYFPLEKNKPIVFPEEGYAVSLKNEIDNDNFIIRELELNELKSNNARTVIQFHYIAWPDFGVPESPTTFLNFLSCVRAKKVLENHFGPAVIHCSAGIGRSGTFALVDTCFVYLEKRIPFDIKETLLEMRHSRMGLIQTAQQLRFSYLAIAQCEQSLQQNRDDTHHEDLSDSDDDPDDAGDNAGGRGDEPLNDDDKNKEKRESRKRHGESNGPHREKREKVQESHDRTSSPLGENHLSSHAHNNVNENIRKRNVEKNIKMRKKIEEIKENMRASEKRWPWKRYVFGGIVASVVIGLAIRYWYQG